MTSEEAGLVGGNGGAVPKALSTGSDLLTLSEVVLKTSSAAADWWEAMFFLSTTSESVEEARARVQKADASVHRSLAQTFAEAAYQLDGVVEVRLNDVVDGLTVTVFTVDRDMERDLTLHRRFTELARDFEGVHWSLKTRVLREDSARDGELIPQ